MCYKRLLRFESKFNEERDHEREILNQNKDLFHVNTAQIEAHNDDKMMLFKG